MKCVNGTSFESYAIDNMFMQDNTNFIEKKNGNCKFSFAFIFNNQTFGVWIDNINSKIFVSSDYVKDTPFMFATTIDVHTPNTMFLNSAKKYACWRMFIDNYNLGNVRFENQKIKNIVQQLIKNIILR